jgi:uncharacterized 2Fe-2S/4Fe-4S cluster protein (DUF4445 family)
MKMPETIMTKTHTIQVLSPAATLRVDEGDLLADVLQSAGIPLSLYCGRRGVCGKCFVEIVRGGLPQSGDEEAALLRQKKLSSRHRLACRYKVYGDLTVRVPERSLLRQVAVLDTGISAPIYPEPAVKKIALELPFPTLATPFSLVEALEKRLAKRLRVPLGPARRLSEISKPGEGRITAVILDDQELLDVEPGDTAGRCFGVAVDIGTSTVVVELVDLGSGRSLGRAAAMNAQVPFGFDVVSRITFAFQDPSNLERLGAVIRDQVGGMIRDLARARGVAPDDIYEIVIAGNTAMNHIFLGVPVSTLALSPFHGVYTAAPEARAGDLGLDVHPAARVYTASNIGSFVGGDISAGLAAIDMEKKDGNFLFIDLGTNGEIVLRKGRRSTATSTAAGPAFEGMTISCGMLALPGAIETARWKDGGFSVKTIGEGPAQGVCGSGLIDILALSLRKGLVSPGGRIAVPSKTIPITGGIVLTQTDVRKMQLAVAAIKSGVRMMLEEAGLGVSDLDGIFVAGAFGASLDVRNAMAVGLLPSVLEDKVVFVGNSSLAGARKLLLSASERRKIESYARKIKHVSLASGRAFQDRFITALELKPYSGGSA